ncbi:MAG: 23S rRNA (adenine(2503)-C(2))-methyltransferase RlmN [Acidimicrobiales bacterium]|nr:23S rRNA (adenine(2503)-C(2))-methyltransferase RlmN [Acidimicrobiales bacterium]
MLSLKGSKTRYGVSQEELGSLLDEEPSYRAVQIWEGLYKECQPLSSITNISKHLRDKLEKDLPLSLNVIEESVSDDGETTKTLFGLYDGSSIETVLMHYGDRTTVCVSSQAGCAMGCQFCATGQSGFDRHLSTGEIVEQVVRSIWHSKPRRISNVVFMGMGEPLANFDSVWSAVERIHADIGISARQITVSTVGVVPGIRRISEKGLPVKLAVSLHAANDDLRNQLVPINRQYGLDSLIQACDEYLTKKRRRISFEWAMIDGINDRENDARELATVAISLRAHVNLIPLNPTPGYPMMGSPMKKVKGFHRLLRSLGVNATIRNNRGTSISAACGQLRLNQGVVVDQETIVPPIKS